MSPSLPDGEPVARDGSLPDHVRTGVGRAPFGLYVHIPFCATRCGYCDFNTYTAQELPGVSRSSYLDLIMAELRLARWVLRERVPKVRTVFFGGGTPSLLPAEHLVAVLHEIDEQFGLAPDAEVTTEANPESVTVTYLSLLREGGFNRVSLGMQSAVPAVLKVLDRQHTPGRAVAAVEEARKAGFDHINLDLIYGAPGESEMDWERSLTVASEAGPDHISAYALVVEPGTRMARQVARGELSTPDDDVLADRYTQADQILGDSGYQWYEVSNWSRTKAGRSRHNLLYWNSNDWWGIGPGAHSHIRGMRWWNVKHPSAYAKRLHAGETPAQAREILTHPQQQAERVLLKIRLRDGLPLHDVPYAKRIEADRMLTYGLFDRDAYEEGKIVLTLRGRLLADAVVRDLVE